MKKTQISQTAKATFMFSLANIIHYGFSILYSPIFARIMSTDEYGMVVLYSSAVSILTTLVTLNVWGVAYIGFLEFKESRPGYIAGTTLIPIVGTLLLAIALLCFPNKLTGLFSLPAGMLWFLLLNTLLTAPFQMWNTEQRYENKYKAIFAVSVTNSASTLIFGVIAVLLFPNDKGEAKIIGSGIVQIIIYAIIWLKILYKGLPSIRKEHIAFTLKMAIPLVPASVSNILLGQTDRVMIAHMLGESRAAIYGIGGSLSGVFYSIVNSAINATWVPYIYRSLDAGKIRLLRRRANQLTAFIAACCILMILVTPEAVLILGGKQYSDSIWSSPGLILALLLAFVGALFSNVQAYYRQTKYLSIGVIVAAMVNIGLNYILIPFFGEAVAGYTSLLSEAVICSINYAFMRHICKTKKNNWKIFDIKTLLLIVVLTLAASIFCTMFLYSMTLVRYLLVALFGICAILNRSKIVKFLQEF